MKVGSAKENPPRQGFMDLQESARTSPTMEKFFPLVFILLSILGINLAKRDVLGEYHVVKWRVIPLVCLTAILVWSLMQNVVFVSNGSVKLIVIVMYLNYISSTCHLLVAVFLAFWKRNEYCKFLTELVLPYHKSKARTHVLNLLLLGYIALSFYLYPWESVADNPLKIVLGIITVLVLPVLPVLVDLQACILLTGLVDAHKDLVRNMQETPITLPTSDKGLGEKSSFGTMINVLPFLSSLSKSEAGLVGSSWVEEGTGAIRVHVVRDQCRYLHDMVTQYNQIFSNLMALRCFLFLIKLMALTFAVLVGYPGSLAKFYLADELIRFYLVCKFSDSLFDLHQEVEDGVLALQESNNTYEEDRLLYHALASRMSARPAFVSIGSTISLGRGMMAAFVNVALTYTIIMFQYRPQE